MSKRYLFLIVAISALFILTLAACQAAKPTQAIQPGLANPASVYCQGLGFKEETRTSAAGQSGVCIFPDNSECDAWDFLAGRCGQANSFCVKQGGKLQTNANSNIATCVFSDNSTCGEFEYFQGQCKPGQNKP